MTPLQTQIWSSNWCAEMPFFRHKHSTSFNIFLSLVLYIHNYLYIYTYYRSHHGVVFQLVEVMNVMSWWCAEAIPIYIKPPTAHPSNSLFFVKLYEHIYIPQIILLNHIPNAFCVCYCQQCLVPSVTKHRTRSHLTFPPGTEHGRGRRGFNPPKTTESQFLYTCMSTFACNIYINIYI